MHFPRRYKIKIEHLDIAPLIDVVFLLLIFFMLTSKFVVASGIKVHLPESRSKEIIRQKGLIIAIDKKGDIYLSRTELVRDKGNRKKRVHPVKLFAEGEHLPIRAEGFNRVNFSELSLALKSLSKDNKSVIIYADRQTALERVIEVWDICRESGIKEIGISAIPK